MIKQRLNIIPKCNTGKKQIKKNVVASKDCPKISWGVGTHKPCAVVGGGISTEQSLEILRKWPGDIFAINDTAGYLSQKGISSYVYSMDCSDILYHQGNLIKGALFATRVNPVQFIYKDIRVWEMMEDSDGTGVGGGPTAASRAGYLFLRTGYMAVVFFGMDASFYGDTHISGNQDAANSLMLIVRANGIDYITNASLLLQTGYLVEQIKEYPSFLINASGGLLKALIENPDTWEVVAIFKDFKKRYAKKGCKIWNTKYSSKGKTIWQPQPKQL